MCNLSNGLWVHSVRCAVYSQSTKMTPKHGGLEMFMFLFLLQWVMFEVSICRQHSVDESCSEQKHVMMMVTVCDAGKRLIKTTQARPDCREFLYVFISSQSDHLHSLKLTCLPTSSNHQFPYILCWFQGGQMGTCASICVYRGDPPKSSQVQVGFFLVERKRSFSKR